METTDLSMDAVPSDPNYSGNFVKLNESKQQHGTSKHEKSTKDTAENIQEGESQDTDQTTGNVEEDAVPSNIAMETNDEESGEDDMLQDFMKQMNYEDGLHSFAEFMSSRPGKNQTDHPVVGVHNDDEKIHRFFLDLTSSENLNWTSFCAELGYSARNLINIAANDKDPFFKYHLQHWLETIHNLGYDAVSHLHLALQNIQHTALLESFRRQFDSEVAPRKPDQLEINCLKATLAKVVPTGNAGQVLGIIRSQSADQDNFVDKNEQLMHLVKDIWDNLTPDELAQIKTYLRSTKRDKFGKKVLQEIKTGVDLMNKLQERDLLAVDNLDFLKKIVHFLKRDDLLKKINQQELKFKNSEGFQMERQHSYLDCSANTPYQMPLDSRDIAIKMQELKLMKNDLEKLEKTSATSPEARKLIQQRMNLKNAKVRKTEDTIQDLKKTSDDYRQKQLNCQMQRKEKEEHIKKLNLETEKLLELEKSYSEKIHKSEIEEKQLVDRNKQQIKDVNHLKNTLEQEDRFEKNRKHKTEMLKRKYAATLATLAKYRQSINGTYPEDDLSDSSSIMCDAPNDDERKSGVPPTKLKPPRESINPHTTGIKSNVREQTLPKDEQQDSSFQELKTRVDSSLSAHSEAEPLVLHTSHAMPQEFEQLCIAQEQKVHSFILVMAADENQDCLRIFSKDVLDTLKVNASSFESFVVPKDISEQFLDISNEKIRHAKLLFILVSSEFVERCWPSICQMKDLNSAFYEQKPLVVPVALKQGVKFPLGMKSAHNLAFYRHDSYYQEALAKLLRQFSQ